MLFFTVVALVLSEIAILVFLSQSSKFYYYILARVKLQMSSNII